jgi:hypothetical protein
MPTQTLATILKARAQGRKVTELARASGVSASAMSQRLNAARAEARAVDVAKQDEVSGQAEPNVTLTVPAKDPHDSLYDSLELIALNNLQRTLPFETSPMRLVKVLDTLNHARRRSNDLPGEFGSNSDVQSVKLIVPVQINAKVVMNENQEVIEINDRPLVTMHPDQMMSALEAKQEQKRLDVSGAAVKAAQEKLQNSQDSGVPSNTEPKLSDIL